MKWNNMNAEVLPEFKNGLESYIERRCIPTRIIESYWNDICYDDDVCEYIESKIDFIYESVAKDNYYFRDNLQIPYVTEVLKKASTKERLIEFAGKFMDEHVRELSTPGPTHNFTFNERNTTELYELFNIDKEKILFLTKEMIKETYTGTTGFHMVKEAPHKILITAILIDAIQHGYDDIIECCEYIMGFCEYPMVFRISWPLGVKEDVMNYTIEHLPNKFKIKKLKTVLELIKYDMNSALNAHRERLKTGLDAEYMDYINRVRNQMKATFKNIAKVYYPNNEANKTMHSQNTHHNDGKLNDDTQGHTTLIGNAVDRTYNKFMNGGLLPKYIAVVSELRQIDSSNLSGYLNLIFSHKNNNIYKFMENLITIFMMKSSNNTELGNGEFLNFGLALYRSIGTSKDVMYSQVNDILNYWINDIIDIRSKYNREATIIAYKRAMYDYLIMMISAYN